MGWQTQLCLLPRNCDFGREKCYLGHSSQPWAAPLKAALQGFPSDEPGRVGRGVKEGGEGEGGVLALVSSSHQP